jgi:hypothetical protein
MILCYYVIVVYRWNYIVNFNNCYNAFNVFDLVSWLRLVFCIYLFDYLYISLLFFFGSIDKIKNSICGRECGYIIMHPDKFNPLNYIFVHLSKVIYLYIFLIFEYLLYIYIYIYICVNLFHIYTHINISISFFF